MMGERKTCASPGLPPPTPVRVGADGTADVTSDKCSLLLVDDEPYILTTLAALAGKDFDVLTAASAEAAMAVFRHRAVDVILTDQKMPGMSGVQLLEWVREQ